MHHEIQEEAWVMECQSQEEEVQEVDYQPQEKAEVQLVDSSIISPSFSQ